MMSSDARLALFGKKGDALACRANLIEAVCERPTVFVLPGIPGGFEGICLFRDEPVPVLARQQFFDGLTLQGDDLAICRSEMGLVAVPVAAGGRIVEIAEGRIETSRENISECMADCFIYQHLRYPLLDLDKLLPQLQP